MKKPHKHAKEIKAWAEGKCIQIKLRRTEQWIDVADDAVVTWDVTLDYRVKPESDIIRFYAATGTWVTELYGLDEKTANLVLIYDGNTGKLKDAKVYE